MTIREKLRLMDEMKKLNDQRVREFLLARKKEVGEPNGGVETSLRQEVPGKNDNM